MVTVQEVLATVCFLKTVPSGMNIRGFIKRNNNEGAVFIKPAVAQKIDIKGEGNS